MFAKALSTVTTEKGAKSHGSTGSGRVDYFFKTLRSTPPSEIHRMLSRAYSESETDAGKLVFQLRDCRGGKGERKAFYESLKWYLENGKSEFVEKHLRLVPYFGYWKDLNELFGTAAEPYVVRLYAEMLSKDKDRLSVAKERNNTGDSENLNVSISLAAKWVPSEDSAPDTKFKAATKIAKQLGVTMKVYRTEYLRPLREHIGIVETYMCGKQWDKIKYGEVPSICMMKHRKAFTKNDSNRFASFLESVKRGEQTINASQLFPHELVAHYISKKQGHDDTINLQYQALVNFYRSKGTLTNAIAICDVSGSMEVPMGQKSGYQVIDASVGLSLLISDCVSEPFRNQIITFSSTPRFHQIKGATLGDRIRDMRNIHDWGQTTNFQAVFEMILQKAKEYTYTDADGSPKVGLPANQLPQTIFVFSDMQFDQTRHCDHCISGKHYYPGFGYGSTNTCLCPSGTLSNLDAIRHKYTVAGYPMPQMVFWNLRGDTPDFPATSDEAGVALVSGYSPALMKLFMTGMSMNPYNAMRAAIDDERYDAICSKEPKTLEQLYYGVKTDEEIAIKDSVKVIKL
jgi:hypothetical protein